MAFLLSLCYYKQTLDVIGIDLLDECTLTKVALTLSGHLGLNVAHTSALELDVAGTRHAEALLSTAVCFHLRHLYLVG